MNRDQKLLCTGVTGSVIAAICCFTPVLVILFGAIGLSWTVGYLDYVLLPALAIFLGLSVYAAGRMWTNRDARQAPDADTDSR